MYGSTDGLQLSTMVRTMDRLRTASPCHRLLTLINCLGSLGAGTTSRGFMSATWGARYCSAAHYSPGIG